MRRSHRESQRLSPGWSFRRWRDPQRRRGRTRTRPPVSQNPPGERVHADRPRGPGENNGPRRADGARWAAAEPAHAVTAGAAAADAGAHTDEEPRDDERGERAGDRPKRAGDDADH